jgi:hypothetical protein
VSFIDLLEDFNVKLSSSNSEVHLILNLRLNWQVIQMNNLVYYFVENLKTEHLTGKWSVNKPDGICSINGIIIAKFVQICKFSVINV